MPFTFYPVWSDSVVFSHFIFLATSKIAMKYITIDSNRWLDDDIVKYLSWSKLLLFYSLNTKHSRIVGKFDGKTDNRKWRWKKTRNETQNEKIRRDPNRSICLKSLIGNLNPSTLWVNVWVCESVHIWYIHAHTTHCLQMYSVHAHNPWKIEQNSNKLVLFVVTVTAHQKSLIFSWFFYEFVNRKWYIGDHWIK